MSESEKLYVAMLCVMESDNNSGIKLEVLELLMNKRKTALFVEQLEVEKEDKE